MSAELHMVLDLGRRLWRRRWWVVLPTVLGVGLAIAAISLKTPLYRASTMILVEPQKIPSDYVKATVTSSLSDRLKTLEQQITNRENLQRIIDELDLYPELRGVVTPETLIRIARGDLTLEVQGSSIFLIYFKGADREKVAMVANRIAEAFIEENLKVRQAQARNTSSFLEEELAATKVELETQEARVAAFRQANEGQLPEHQASNLSALSQLRTRLDLVRKDITDLELRQSLLVRSSSFSDGGNVGAAAPASPIDLLRAELASLRAQYTPNHPDVIRVEQQLAALEAQAAASTVEGGTGTPALDAQLAATELELRRKRQEQQDILAQIGRYQNRLERIPRVEQELLQLTRDYDNVRASYDSLLEKGIEARLAENLETERQSEQFTILERAVPPSRPFAPNKTLFLALGLLGGGGLGLGLAFVRDQLEQTFRDTDSLEAAFPAVRVLAVVPRLEPQSDAPDSEVA